MPVGLGPRHHHFGIEGDDGDRIRLAVAEHHRLGDPLRPAQLALEESIKYAKERTQFGRPIAKFQMIGFKIADMKLLTDTARLLIYKAAWLKQLGDPGAATAASVAKLVASETSTQIASMAVQVHGGYGYITEYPIARAFADARVHRIYGGTNEIMREIVGRQLAGKR